jgi:predicted ester cyclase
MKSLKILSLFLLFNSSLFAQKKAVLKINNPQNSNSETTTAIAVSKAILEANWAKLDELLDEKFTYTGDGYVFSKDEYIGFMQDMRAAFSNFEMVLDKSVQQDNLVSIKFISYAVNTGKFMGAPANKKNLEVNGIFMRKIEGGKVKQEWQTTDLLGTMTQIGGGSLFFYSVFVGGFNVKQKAPVRKPNDFLNINGSAEAYDLMSAKEKNNYVKTYMNNLKKKAK